MVDKPAVPVEPQVATPPTMFHPERPTSNEHVLHRQPRLSPLSRRRELAERAFGLWAARVRDHEPREHMKDGAQFHHHQFPAHLLERKDTGRSLKHGNQRGVVTEISYDAPRTGSPSSEYLEGVARHSTAPRSTTPFILESWGPSRLSTYGRQSSEWETETLLDQSSCGLDDMAPYPCPFRKRNPIRFNIRDHETCARAPFDSIRGLK